VIKQGDSGDFMFVIESGALDCLITKDGAEVVVKTCEVATPSVNSLSCTMPRVQHRCKRRIAAFAGSWTARPSTTL